MPINSLGVGPPTVQLQSATNRVDLSNGSAATPPKETAVEISKPVEEAPGVQVAGFPAESSDVGKSVTEWNVTKAADELAAVRAQAARLTGELKAEGLLPTYAARQTNEARAAAQNFGNAIAQTREIDAAAELPKTSTIV